MDIIKIMKAYFGKEYSAFVTDSRRDFNRLFDD